MADSISALFPDADITQDIGGTDNRFNTIHARFLEDTSTVPVESLSNMRRPLTGPLVLYVNKTGSDDNSGLTGEAALLTFEGLRRTVSKIDGAGYSITVIIGAGSWDEELTLNSASYLGFSSISIMGASKDSTFIDRNNTSPYCIRCTGVHNLIIQNIGLRNCTYCELYFDRSSGDINNLDFGATVGSHIVAINYASLLFSYSGTFNISGGSNGFISALSNSFVGINNASIDIAGTPVISAFLVIDGGRADVTSLTYTGDVSGIGYKYSVKMQGLLNTGGALSDIPGTNVYVDTASGGLAF